MRRGSLLLLVVVFAWSAVATASPVEIEFVFPANESESHAWYELVDRFNAGQDEVHVTAQLASVPGGWAGFQERMLVAIAGGVSPDIMRLSDEALPEWAANGFLRPLDDWLARDVDVDQFLPPVVQLGSYAGRFYGFPQGLATRALAYNRALFDQAGLPYPDDTWRWDNELLDAARQLTTRAADGRAERYGIGVFLRNSETLRKDIPEIIWSFGGEVFDAEGNLRLGDQESSEALGFLQSLVAEYQVHPTNFDVHVAFLDGTLAMWNTGVWDVALLRQQGGLDWDFAPTPGGPGGHYSFIQGNGVYVIPISVPDERAEAAWRFMQYLASEEAQRIFGLEYGIGGVPLQRNLTPDYLNQPAPPENWQAFVTSANRGRMANHPLEAGRIFDALNVGWNDMIRGNMAVENWFQSVRRSVEGIVAASQAALDTDLASAQQPFEGNGVWTVLGYINQDFGITQQEDNDGVTLAVEIDDVVARKTVRGVSDGKYMYFDVADYFLYNVSGIDVELGIEYLDQGPGTVQVQYDSNNPAGGLQGAYTDGFQFELGDTGEWKTVSGTLYDVRFGNRQNRGTDFRLGVGSDELIVRQVWVKVLD